MVKLGLQATALSTLLLIVLTLWTLGQLPDTGEFATHWNAAGEANGFSDKSELTIMMWGFVALSALMGGLFAILPRIAPLRENLMKSSKAYLTGWIGSQFIMVFCLFVVGYSAVKGNVNNGEELNVIGLIKIIVFATSAMLIILGNYLPKTRPNWFVGIRTPWSLSSAESWEKTHRLAGTLFVLSGIIAAIAIWIIPIEVAVYVFISLITFAALIPIIASYKFWKDAPDKVKAP